MENTTHILDKNVVDVLNKVQDVKEELRGLKLKKSGYNKHNKYKYFELEDIIPTIEVILKKYNLASTYMKSGDDFILIIYDKETRACFSWNTPLTPIQAKENGYDMGIHMKGGQAVQTYARRTLWLQALDILEKNNIEMQKSPTKNDFKKKQTNKKPVKTESAVDHATAELNSIISMLNLTKKEVTLTNVVEELKLRVNNGLDDNTASEVLARFKEMTKEGGN